ncbi:uncharacterized protein B0P05DRAFT_522392, partial [Gilbertella persicaria]|uniref:uncharacterized protein n=1 Tax=Gilbertella persicaria TaxID=101096 RepID=UPI00221FCE12
MEISSSFVVFSGGSACNHILDSFHKTGANQVSYILGISDNGGSTSELLRVLGGPSVGDLRSRLIRLMNTLDEDTSKEMKAIKDLLSYRLPADKKNHQKVRDEWALIVEGRHSLWNDISIEKREAIRGFLTLFDFEILKRAHKRFNFCNGSIGNFFLTGARLFTGSLEAAIFLFASITGITSAPTSVVPVINTNQTATIAASLLNGETLVGQCEISHPSPYQQKNKKQGACTPGRKRINPIDAFSFFEDPFNMIETKLDDDDNDNDTNANLFFSKQVDQKLTSPINRIYYINEYGQEIYPVPNPKVISHISSKKTLVYSIGSLYTSLVPCLVLRGVGNSIVQSQTLKHKILLLNGTNDRETSDYTALDFINAITRALNESQRIDARRAFYESCEDDDDQEEVPDYISSRASSISSAIINTPPSYSSQFSSMTIGSMPASPSHRYPPFPNHSFYPSSPSSFITHLIYLDNSAIPVDIEAIQRLGIQCVCMRGATSVTGEPIYDQTSVTEAIESIVNN